MASGDLRPLSVGEIMNGALRIYWSRFATLVGLVAAFVLPFEILYALAVVSASRAHGGSFANLASALLLVLVGDLASAACVKAVIDTILGYPTSWRASFDFVWRRLGPVLAVSILDVAIVAVGFFLLVLPGLYLDVSLLVATPALLVEGIGPVAALQRSRELVRHLWWRTFGAYLLAALFVGLVSLIPTVLVLHAVGASTSATGSPLASQVVSVVTSLLTTPFMASVVALLYIDLRVRKEGIDLHHVASGVAGSAGGPAPMRRGPVEPPYPDL